MQKIIILKSDDTIESKEYKGYDSIHDAVDGLIENCGRTQLPLAIGKPLSVSFWCNEEFLIRNDEKFDKVNAIASTICGQEIRGDVAVTVDVWNENGLDSRGFKYLEEEVGDGEIEEAICEHWLAADTLLLYINQNKDILKEMHEKYDGNKSEPKYEFQVLE